MTEKQWHIFSDFRKDFKLKCDEWTEKAGKLNITALVHEACKKDTPPYSLETSVVYNKALDDVTEKSEIRYIVVGDNPGKDEQLLKNNRYLVGQSGKLGERFFKMTDELKADFRQNVIILNKTPVHTAKTNHLRSLFRADSHVAELISESQKWMAQFTANLHIGLVEGAIVAGEIPQLESVTLVPELWLVGYAELKKNGIFSLYRDTLLSYYERGGDIGADAWQYVMAFQHFSMNRFTIDLNMKLKENSSESIVSVLSSLGTAHRKEIFGK